MTRQSAAMMMAIVCAIATAMCAPSSPSSVVPSAPKVRILTEQEVIDTWWARRSSRPGTRTRKG